MSQQVYRDALADAEIVLGERPGCIPCGFAEESATSTVFFPGCSLINYIPELVGKAYSSLKQYIPECGISMVCCAKSLEYEPDAAPVRVAHEEKLIDCLSLKNVEKLIIGCPNCYKVFRNLKKTRKELERLELVPLPSALTDAGLRIPMETLEKFSPAKDVVINLHESCPDRTDHAYIDGVIRLLPPEIQKSLGKGSISRQCCGAPYQSMGKWDVCNAILDRRKDQLEKHGVSLLITSCVNCARALSCLDNESLRVCHYLELVYDTEVDWQALSGYMQLRFLLVDYGADTDRDFCAVDPTGANGATS
ncbi:MAG: hypothetical protein LUB61_05260 [Eggerthellaceae bacterium]|nr:hypothetical protein [Eggerthellaceae bacterium]